MVMDLMKASKRLWNLSATEAQEAALLPATSYTVKNPCCLRCTCLSSWLAPPKITRFALLEEAAVSLENIVIYLINFGCTNL